MLAGQSHKQSHSPWKGVKLVPARVQCCNVANQADNRMQSKQADTPLAYVGGPNSCDAL